MILSLFLFLITNIRGKYFSDNILKAKLGFFLKITTKDVTEKKVNKDVFESFKNVYQKINP